MAPPAAGQEISDTEYTGADCELASYALSDLQMRPLGGDVALVTYKATVDRHMRRRKAPGRQPGGRHLRP
jgi:hypothetical protein